MSRKRTPDEKSTETTTTETTAAVAEPAAPETSGNGQSFADRVGQRKRITAADPFGIAMDNVAGVRLFESKQDRQMAIKFEDKPNQAVIDKMKEAGFRWKPEDRIWALPLRADSNVTTRIDAE